MSKTKSYQSVFEGASERLDKVVVVLFGERLSVSRAQAEKWIEQGCVCIDGETTIKSSCKVTQGQIVAVCPPTIQGSHLAPLAFPLDILFEDDHLVVVNKPAGLSMHPGAGNSTHTLANALVAHIGPQQLKVGEVDRPGIVHRLDKDTTGIVVVAKSTPVHAGLAKQFADRTIDRTYISLVFTTPRAVRAIQKSDEGTISKAIARHSKDRKLMAISEDGKPAVTHWRVKERFHYGTVLECKLQTGRTHQIRVHLNSIGSPVVGDRAYGDFSSLPSGLRDAAREFGRQALHAHSLVFIHPVTREKLSFEAALPPDMEHLMQTFRLAVS